MGRPRSPVPLAVRRRLARQAYKGRLAERGLVLLRVLLPRDVAARLTELAQSRGISTGQVVADLL